MAIVSAEIAHSKWDASVGNASTQYQIVYNVKTNDRNDGPIAIFNYFEQTVGLPYLGDYYQYFGESDPYSFCTKLSPRKKDNSDFEWAVTVLFEQSSANPLDENGNPAQNPLDYMRQFEFNFAPQQVPVEQAMYHGQNRISGGDTAVFIPPPATGYYADFLPGEIGLPANSAGDAFDPPMMKEQSDLILHCRMNLASYDGDVARSIQDKVNFSDMQLDLSGTIYNLTLKMYRWQCKCMNIGATFNVREWVDSGGSQQRTFFWEVVYEFHIRTGLELLGMPPLGWSEWLPDRGYNRSAREGDPDGAGGVMPAPAAGDPLTMRVKGRDGFPVSEPVNLDGAGQPLDPDSTPRFLHYMGIDTAEMIGMPVGFTAWNPTP